ncbi:50S ribosomal protein L32 [Patescibacteria group bacterium]|nr:50S ribosomal protein L32 [Patescibacteria group bacterium]
MSSRMRITSGKARTRRSHHGIDAPRLSTCVKCGSFHLRHRMCDTCGTYKDRQVIDINAKIEKKNERRVAKMKSLGIDPNAKDKKEAPLDVKKLSEKKKK